MMPIRKIGDCLFISRVFCVRLLAVGAGLERVAVLGSDPLGMVGPQGEVLPPAPGQEYYRFRAGYSRQPSNGNTGSSRYPA